MNALIPLSTDPLPRTRRALLFGGEYWSSRDVMIAMDRDDWDAFASVASTLPSAEFVREGHWRDGANRDVKPDYRLNREDAERLVAAFRSAALVAA